MHTLMQIDQLKKNLTNTGYRLMKYKYFTKIRGCKFNMKSDSNGDIHLAHIEPKIRSLEPLTYLSTDRRFVLVWAGLAHHASGPLAEKQ